MPHGSLTQGVQQIAAIARQVASTGCIRSQKRSIKESTK